MLCPQRKMKKVNFSKLYWVLGSMSIHNKFPSLIFKKEHEQALLDLCAKIQISTHIAMSIAPIQNGDNFSDIVIQIINLYGNRNFVLGT